MFYGTQLYLVFSSLCLSLSPSFLLSFPSFLPAFHNYVLNTRFVSSSLLVVRNPKMSMTEFLPWMSFQDREVDPYVNMLLWLKHGVTNKILMRKKITFIGYLVHEKHYVRCVIYITHLTFTFNLLPSHMYFYPLFANEEL